MNRILIILFSLMLYIMDQKTTPPGRIPSDIAEKPGRRDSRTVDYQTQNKFSPGPQLEKNAQLIPRERPKVSLDTAVEKLVRLPVATEKARVRGFSVLIGGGQSSAFLFF